MTDITERLRRLYVQHGTDYVQEAADEIERLRAELQRAASMPTASEAARNIALEQKLDEAQVENEQMRAELDDIAAALPGVRYMDPPDGGDVSIAEQVQRMRAELYRLTD